MKDSIFAQPISQPQPFAFDERVADVFSDMARRSIPGYENIIATIGQLSEAYATDGSVIYDLGCSLGAASAAMRKALDQKRQVEIIAIDNSPAMVERCQNLLSCYRSSINVKVKVGDITKEKITNASMVVLNFVLQFISPDSRDDILRGIYQGLQPGGIFVLSEKLKNPDPIIETALTDRYFDFKRHNGYSDLEISQKRTALEDVLISDTWQDLSDRLHRAGFEHFDRWFQTYNFCSVIAIK